MEKQRGTTVLLFFFVTPSINKKSFQLKNKTYFTFSAFIYETQVETFLATVASGTCCIELMRNSENPTSTKVLIVAFIFLFAGKYNQEFCFEKCINILRNVCQYSTLQIFINSISFVFFFLSSRNYGMHCCYQTNCPINSFRWFKQYELQDSIFSHSCSSRHSYRCVRMGDELCSV